MRRVLCGSVLVFLSSSCLRVTPLLASTSFRVLFDISRYFLVFVRFIADESFIFLRKRRKKEASLFSRDSEEEEQDDDDDDDEAKMKVDTKRREKKSGV